ncbi:VOC family protein [Actinoallomurus spadix]|uniref:VOC family protein n=1 Tax=Actinoallomurus spadix TaxID=79912 RepID=A0ABP3G1F6_9ACTN|nr:VOC family protein [Actinoallomurus spadix]MCO5991395.1 VOC family protein [Actinoallomurus spadix]
MSDRPELSLIGFVLDAPDARELAGFYRRLLGWETVHDDPAWVKLEPPGGGPSVSFQTAKEYVPPTWPAEPDHQRMMAHLDIRVHDLNAAVAYAIEQGAVLAEHQPQERALVCRDPAGHPFCLALPGA